MNVTFDYESMTHEELVRHVVAYAESIHILANRCMVAEGKLRMIVRNVLCEDGLRP
jgi:hypothetical protein